MRQFEITVELEDGVTEIGVLDFTKHQACAKYIEDNHPELYAVLREQFNFNIQVYELQE